MATGPIVFAEDQGQRNARAAGVTIDTSVPAILIGGVPLIAVAPGTTQYVLTSNGTIWQSVDPSANTLLRTFIWDLARYVNPLGAYSAVEYVKAGAPTGAAAGDDEQCLDTTTATLYISSGGVWGISEVLANGDKAVHARTGTDTSGDSGTHTASNQVYTSNGTTATGAAPAYRDMFVDESPLGGNNYETFFDGAAWVAGFAAYLQTVNSAFPGTLARSFYIGKSAYALGVKLYFGDTHYIEYNADAVFSQQAWIFRRPVFADRFVTNGTTFTDANAISIAGQAGGIVGEFVGADNDIHAGDGVYGRVSVRSYGNLQIGPSVGDSREGDPGLWLTSDAALTHPLLRVWTTTSGLNLDLVAGTDGKATALPIILGKVIQLNNLTASTVPYADANKQIVSSAVTPTELGYVSGVTSAIQTQLNGKAATSHNHAASDINSGTLDDARLPAEVPLTDEANTFSTVQTFTGIRRATRSEATDYTVTVNDYYVSAQPVAAGMDLTLPSAASCDGQEFVFINEGAGDTVNVDPGAASFVDYTASPFTGTLGNLELVAILSDGTNWVVTQYRLP